MPQTPGHPTSDQPSQAAAQDRETRYHALFHNKTVAMARYRIIADSQGHPVNQVVEEVNEAYERIVGIQKAAIEGRLITEVFPGIERFSFDFIGNLGRIGLQGGEMDHEVYFPATQQWLSIHAYGSASGECTAIFTDVTARKQAEAVLRRQQAQLQAIVDNSPVLISMKDTQGRVILAGQALLDLMGAQRSEDVVGRSVFELFPADVAKALWANDLAALQSDAPVRAEEAVQDKDGRWRTFLTVKFPVRDAATGEAHGVCAISTDITERQQHDAERLRLEAQLQASHRELERRVEERTAQLKEAQLAADLANQAKSDFLATFSHEMRTPLNGVIGMTGLLMAGPLDESKRRHVEVVRDSGTALLHLLNDFLDFAKIEAGHLALESTAFNPARESMNALSLVQPSAERKGLRVGGEAHGPVLVHGDAARLRQILLNLLSNAVKFTDRGEVTLRCSEASRGEGRVVMLFEVSDTGIGIDADVQQTLFLPFVQADASTTRRFGGTGLGLAICKRLTEAMGGQIGLRSTAGQGSTFWVRLPFDLPPDEASAGGQGAATASESAVAKQADRPSVLVVEDSMMCQRVAKEMLTLLGCQVDVARDGSEAVQALQGKRYRLVFMDRDMPGMDGFEAMKHIRAQELEGTRIPVVACTASAMQGDAEQCLAAGMDDFISKPLLLQELRRIIEKWIG